MRTAFKIAWRFLVSNRGQTVLIALGIAIGVSVQVFIGSLIAGLQKSLVDTTIGSSSQITVKAQDRNGRVADYEALVDTIAARAEGLTFVSPAADASGFLKTGESVYPILLRGLDFVRAEGIYKLSKSLVLGALPDREQVMLGKELMEEAGLSPGDTVSVRTPAGDEREVVVSGQFDFKVTSLNRGWALAEIPLVQSIFNFGATATSIEIQVADPFAADKIAETVEKLLPSELKAENWKALNASLLSGLSGQSISSLMIQVFVLVSVVLGIASVLAISVMQKSRQLGILKAMGIKNRTASLIFLFQGFVLGILGAIMGVGFGLGLALMFTKFAVKPDGSPVVALLIDMKFIALSGAIAVLSATLASLVPARRSSKLDPMEVIRNG